MVQAAPPAPLTVTIPDRRGPAAPEPAQPRPDAAKADQAPAAVARVEPPRSDTPKPPVEPAKSEALKFDQPNAGQAPAVVAKVEPPKPAPPRPEPPKSEPLKFEQAKTDLPKSEPPRPRPEPPKPARLAALKPVPVPPPVPQPSPVNQEPDDAQSVLARLRQLAPGGPAPAPQAVAATPTVPATPPIEARPRAPAQPASLPALNAARAALAGGKVEDARRLLQQTQLQLVFRPVNAAGEDSPLAARGAADVARALDALGANDATLSRRYIDSAVADLSGTGAAPPSQDAPVRTTGYAPAYPPRY
jgi:hypothetical protein